MSKQTYRIVKWEDNREDTDEYVDELLWFLEHEYYNPILSRLGEVITIP